MWKNTCTFCAAGNPPSTGDVDDLHGFSTLSGEIKYSPFRPPLFHGKTSGNVENRRRRSLPTFPVNRHFFGYFRLLILVVMAFTVSEKAASLAMRLSTCSMECITVVWSRLPNSLPMSL